MALDAVEAPTVTLSIPEVGTLLLMVLLSVPL
jgi:hypothetical protein